MSNTTRIAKNTLMLYFRQILIMLVSLYTVRVVLETLGAEDYGIYNVVAGIVTMFSFLNGSMAVASQRYFSFWIGRDDYEHLKRTFNLSLIIHVLIALLVVLLAETIGFWLLNNKLIIPAKRMDAAQMIYQFSIVSFFCSIMVTPYIALVIAHEDMNIYASISVIEALLKLGIVVFLRFIPVDKLQLYGILICIATFVNTVMYRIICKIKYHECKFYFYWNQELFKEIMSYTGWNLFGTVAALLKNQAVNILLNQFFNPAVIAARSISSNVNSAVSSFSLNFSIVMRPQIIKSYALGKKEEMLSLMFSSAKGTYLLMYIFTLPLVLEIPIVLSIWLKNPPEYTILFTRLTLVDVLIDSISYPVMAAIHATGKIKLYQFVVGSILLLNLPLSWIALLLHVPSYSVIIIGICLTCITSIIRFFMLKRLVDYSIFYFFKKILLPMGIVSVLSAMLPLLVHSFLEQSILRLCIIIVVSMISTCICIYFIGLNKTERIYIKTQLKKKLI